MTLDIQLDKASQVMEQAWMTAETYLHDGVRCIDKEFGAGYAGRHPELLAAFMRTCAQDYHTGIMKAGLLIQTKLGHFD
jgi:hypothetical protein